MRVSISGIHTEMSFSKAVDLLRLAQMAASRRGGVSLGDICEEFGVSHRTAQRMTEAMELVFANVTTSDAEDRRKYWRLEAPPPERLQARQETAIEALEIAARSARDQSRLRHAQALDDLRDGLMARLTPRDAFRTEADAEAVLAGLGHVMRPGPTVAMRPELTDAVIEALYAEMSPGEKLFYERCTVCHGPRDVSAFTQLQWKAITPSMFPRAGLDDAEAAMIMDFLMANASDAKK